MFTKDILFGMNILTLAGFIVMGLSLTLQRMAAAGRRIFAAATHGLFMGQAPGLLADPLFEGIAVTDTVRSVAAAEGRLPQRTTSRGRLRRRVCSCRDLFQ